MPSSVAARNTRVAISPRFAAMSLVKGGPSSAASSGDANIPELPRRIVDKGEETLRHRTCRCTQKERSKIAVTNLGIMVASLFLIGGQLSAFDVCGLSG